MNNASRDYLYGTATEGMVSADLDGGGEDDLMIGFGAGGLWRHMNNAGWQPLHGASPTGMAAGNLDGQ